jgi:hypothetical protein
MAKGPATSKDYPAAKKTLVNYFLYHYIFISKIG